MARRKRHAAHGGGHGSDERWLLTYADMITLLLAFFIVLYAISNTDVRKFTAFAQSVSAAFNVDVFQGTQAISISGGTETTPDEGFDTGSGVVATDRRTIEASLRDLAISLGVQDSVDVTASREGTVIRISGSLLFESGRAVLDDASIQLLDRISALLKPLPNRIRIDGNTDDIQPDGLFFKDNWELSAARARAVLDSLVTRGVAPSRLSFAAHAEFDPIVANTDDAARARNRRVDLVLLYDGGTPQATAAAPLIPTFKP
jgi:chemotaxis protein MotB